MTRRADALPLANYILSCAAMTPTSRTDSPPVPALSVDQQARLDDLIDRYELARDVGKPILAEELCEHDPDLLTQLLDALRRLQ